MAKTPHPIDLLFAALLAFGIVGSARAQEQAATLIPPGTEVVVRTTDFMTSASATTGQKFAVEVDADVVVDGVVVLPAGTRGGGTIVFARKKGMSGRPGALDVRIDSVEGPDGPIKLRASETNRGTDRRRSGAAAGLAFGLIGFAAVQGTDINLPAGSLIPTTVVAPRVASSTIAPVPATGTATAPQPTPAGASTPQFSEAPASSDTASKDQP
jgi:hypothetical protein